MAANLAEYDRIIVMSYEFTSSGILCINHINCRDQLCVNLDTGELIQYLDNNTMLEENSELFVEF